MPSDPTVLLLSDIQKHIVTISHFFIILQKATCSCRDDTDRWPIHFSLPTQHRRLQNDERLPLPTASGSERGKCYMLHFPLSLILYEETAEKRPFSFMPQDVLQSVFRINLLYQGSLVQHIAHLVDFKECGTSTLSECTAQIGNLVFSLQIAFLAEHAHCREIDFGR